LTLLKLDWPVPRFSAVSRRRATLTVKIPVRRQIGPDAQLGSFSGDGAYDTRGVHRAAHAQGADVIVPPRRNGQPWKDKTAFVHVRNETLAAVQRLGWPLWKK